jgi:L-iditol 2-dehydrogenase
VNGFRAVVKEPTVVEIEQFEPPEPQSGQVLIRTRASLISPGTERAFFLALPNTNAAYPLYPGYSNIGEVIALGDGVEGLQVGDRVASGAPHASHVVMDAVACQRVPEQVSDEDATFFNLIAIAMQGVRKTRIELGEPVIVIGVGPIGMFALQLAKLNGALPVIAIDQDEHRLELARTAGADVALTNDERLQAAIREQTGADGAPVVIEATGAPAAILLAFRLAMLRGRVSLLGSARGETDGVNFYRDVHRKGLSVIGAHEITRPRHDSLPGWWTQADEHRVALRLLAMQRLSVQPLISHRFTWQAFPQAYELLTRRDSALFGMVIDWA